MVRKPYEVFPEKTATLEPRLWEFMLSYINVGKVPNLKPLGRDVDNFTVFQVSER